MGYYARKLKEKKHSPDWKVQYISCKRKDQSPDSKSKNPKRTWDIPSERWRPLGIHASMSFEEVKVRVKQLNSQLRMKRQEEQIKKLRDTQNDFQLRHQSMLPE